jgi:hypothetical protein
MMSDTPSTNMHGNETPRWDDLDNIVKNYIEVPKPLRYREIEDWLAEAPNTIRAVLETPVVPPRAPHLNDTHKQTLVARIKETEVSNPDQTNPDTEKGQAMILQVIRNYLGAWIDSSAIAILTQELARFEKLCALQFDESTDRLELQELAKNLKEQHKLATIYLHRGKQIFRTCRGGEWAWILEPGTLKVVEELGYEGSDRETRRKDITDAWMNAKAIECAIDKISHIFDKMRELDKQEILRLLDAKGEP